MPGLGDRLKLPVLGTQGRRPVPKPVSRKRVKGRKDRVEAARIKIVRAACVERDGYCAIGASDNWRWDWGKCDGPSEWAHLVDKRRSRTMGMAPEIRHTVEESFMACRWHHAEYDQHRLDIRCLTPEKMNGPFQVVTR